MKRIFILVLAAAGSLFFGCSSQAGEVRHGHSVHGSSSGFSITIGGGGRHFDGRHLGPRSDHRHFGDRHSDRRHFDRHDRHFHRNDLFHDRKFRHGPFDGRRFDGRFHDHRFKGDHRFHDRRFFRPHGGIVFYGGSGVDSDAYREEGAVVEEDSRTVTYRGNETAPDDPDSRTVTYRGSRGGRIGNVPGP